MEQKYLDSTQELISFLSKSPTAFQAVDNLSKMLESNGFVKLHEGDSWAVRPGMKFYITRNMTSILAFRVPTGRLSSIMLAASHTDSPAFKIKANAENEAFGKYIRLNTEKYGGGILSSWFDRPLSAAGRVIVRTENGFICKSAVIDRDLCLIPNVAIHMKRDLNDGYKINPAVDTVPLLGEIASKGAWNRLLSDAVGADEKDIAASDMYLYDRTGGRIWGAGNEFYSSPRIDNMQCAFATLKGFLASEASESVLQVYASFDNEETGSSTKQGAASGLLADALGRITSACGADLREVLASSFMLSADNGHAMHPNHPEYADKDNAPHLNGGVVIKYNASQRYTTDALSAAIFQSICSHAGVPTQVYANRSDIPGGGTLGSISNVRVAMNTVDIGLAQLAMHSCYETGGCMDTLAMTDASRAFFSTSIKAASDGEYAVF